MSRGKPYVGEFKQKVIEWMRNEGLSFRETAREYGVDHKRVMDWERIYLEEGAAGLYVDRRDQARGKDLFGLVPGLKLLVEALNEVVDNVVSEILHADVLYPMQRLDRHLSEVTVADNGLRSPP